MLDFLKIQATFTNLFISKLAEQFDHFLPCQLEGAIFAQELELLSIYLKGDPITRLR